MDLAHRRLLPHTGRVIRLGPGPGPSPGWCRIARIARIPAFPLATRPRPCQGVPHASCFPRAGPPATKPGGNTTKQVSSAWGLSVARTYADWREMLDKEALDIVSVATYSPVHAEITVECAERGIRAIYCEKPIATRLPDAEKMLAACEKSGSLLAINHNRRFDSNYRRLRDLISNGGLGEIISVNLQWAGGRLGNVGTHNFDAAAMLTSSRIESVSGTLDLAGKPDCRGPDFQDPGGWGILRLASGAKITVDAVDYATTPYLTIVNGTKGRARAGLFKTEFVLEFVDGTSETWEKPLIRPSGMDTCVSEIVAWMDDGTPFSHPAEEALNTFEAIVAFHASHARNGGWVDLPLKGEDRDWVVNTG